MMFRKELYDDSVYAWHKEHADEYEKKTGRALFEHYDPDSVCDFGCGIGSYLEVAFEMGASIKGYEIGGEHAAKYMKPSIAQFIDTNRDVTEPIKENKYDIVLCVEVAEHVEPDKSSILVENLAKATDGICVFTAAPPGQEGHQHINCRPRSFWISLFNQFGMIESNEDFLTVQRLWEGAPDYVLRNLCVFKHGGSENS